MNKINTDEYEILEGKRGLGHKYADEMKELILKKPEDDEIEFIEGFKTSDLLTYVLDNYDNGNIINITYIDDFSKIYVFERKDEYSKYKCIGIIPNLEYQISPKHFLDQLAIPFNFFHYV